MNAVFIFIAFFLYITGQNVQAQTNAPLINWFAGADIVATGNSESELNSGLAVREFEFSANSFIDHIWQGTLTLSKHNEPGESDHSIPEVHEAFVFTNSIIERGHLKLGKFFLGFGRLNRFHRHDWAITEAPYYHQQFFGTEGVKDTGIEYGKLLSMSKFIKLTLGITAGNEFVHAHDHDDEHEEESEKAHVPTHYLRLSSFKEFSTTRGMEYGLNYVGRTDSEGIRYSYYGLDFIYKNRVRKFVEKLAQFEIWNRSRSHDGETENDLGAYIYYEKGFDQNHSLGFKLEYYKPGSHEEHGEDEHGIEVEDQLVESGVSYIYTNSEFLKTRLTISHAQGYVVDEKEVSNTKGVLQLVFNIGAHPAHLY